MNPLFILLYFVFICLIGLASFFIVYHLRRYSINQKLTRPLIVFFVVVTIILVVINAIVFFSIPFDDVARSPISF